jgi:hypothetical protein
MATKGPWFAKSVGVTDAGTKMYEITNGHRILAEYIRGDDAFLIAAAPELLDALKAVADPSVRTDSLFFATAAIERFRVIANAAIAKAEGKLMDTDTPRVDAFCQEPTEFVPGQEASLIPVWADFARQLERENRELLEALKLCYEHCRLYHREVEHNNVGEAVRATIAKAEGKA